MNDPYDRVPPHLRHAVRAMHERLSCMKRSPKFTRPVTVAAARVAVMLQQWVGLNNLDLQLHEIDWSENVVAIKQNSWYPDLSSTDSGGATRLLDLACEHAIRVEFYPAAVWHKRRRLRAIKITFGPRSYRPQGTEYDACQHHKSLEDRIAELQNRLAATMDAERSNGS